MSPNKRIKTHFVRADIYLWARASRKFSPQVAALYAGRYVLSCKNGVLSAEKNKEY